RKLNMAPNSLDFLLRSSRDANKTLKEGGNETDVEEAPKNITKETPPTVPVPVTSTESNFRKFEKFGEKTVDIVAEKTHIPVWGVLLILLVILLIILACIYFYFRKLWQKFTSSDKGSKFKGLDIKGLDLIGNLTKEKVQPDEGGLIDNMEANEDEQQEGEKKEPEKLGKLQFKIDYDFNTTNLTVGIIQAEELVAMDSGGTSDPYVKVYLLPDKKKKFETKVHRKTLNPVFNETFVFKSIPYAEIMTKTLVMSVFDFDRFSKHDQIGEIRIPFNRIDLAAPIEEWRDLDPPMDEESEKLGDICFSLRYVPTSGKLTVCILEARNLKKMDFGGLSDPFVKITLYMNGKKFKKKKTSVKKCTLNPYFNESFVFEIKPDQLPRCHIVLTVLDYDRIGTCDAIGKVAVGPNQEGNGLKHWQDMINTPRRPIAQWHSLKDPEEVS
ncbi:synaptotagmin 1:-like isoform H, partial [Dinothrombium tinctorium]